MTPPLPDTIPPDTIPHDTIPPGNFRAFVLLPRQVHYERASDKILFFYRSGIDSTYEIDPDLAPAMRMALGEPRRTNAAFWSALTWRVACCPFAGAPQASEFDFEWERFTWLKQAWGKAQSQTDLTTWSPPESIILDGELLVYDEGITQPGLYDELGSKPGVVSFGTHFWLSVNVDPETNQPVGGRYSRDDCRRHYLVKVRLPCPTHLAYRATDDVASDDVASDDVAGL